MDGLLIKVEADGFNYVLDVTTKSGPNPPAILANTEIPTAEEIARLASVTFSAEVHGSNAETLSVFRSLDTEATGGTKPQDTMEFSIEAGSADPVLFPMLGYRGQLLLFAILLWSRRKLGTAFIELERKRCFERPKKSPREAGFVDRVQVLPSCGGAPRQRRPNRDQEAQAFPVQERR